MSDDGVEFEDHVVLARRVERAEVHADGGGPVGVALVDGGEATREGDDTLPEGIVARGSGDGERVDDVEIHVDFNEAASIPVKWN